MSEDRQCSSCGGFCKKSGCERENIEPTPDPIYTAPPKKEWVGLTDEQKKEICQEAANEDWTDLDVINATEAKLKEKNG